MFSHQACPHMSWTCTIYLHPTCLRSKNFYQKVIFLRFIQLAWFQLAWQPPSGVPQLPGQILPSPPLRSDSPNSTMLWNLVTLSMVVEPHQVAVQMGSKPRVIISSDSAKWILTSQLDVQSSYVWEGQWIPLFHFIDDVSLTNMVDPPFWRRTVAIKLSICSSH